MKHTTYLLAAALLLAAGGSAAQTYPAKPIRIIVPFPAGGIADLFGRVIGQKFTESLGTGGGGREPHPEAAIQRGREVLAVDAGPVRGESGEGSGNTS
jgi:hypothetical protein